MRTTDITATQKEGWFLYRHYVGHYLSLIEEHAQRFRSARAAEIRRAEANTVEAARAQILDHLHQIVDQMRASDHADDVADMQVIIDLIKNADLLDKETVERIRERHKEVCRRNRTLS